MSDELTYDDGPHDETAALNQAARRATATFSIAFVLGGLAHVLGWTGLTSVVLPLGLVCALWAFAATLHQQKPVRVTREGVEHGAQELRDPHFVEFDGRPPGSLVLQACRDTRALILLRVEPGESGPYQVDTLQTRAERIAELLQVPLNVVVLEEWRQWFADLGFRARRAMEHELEASHTRHPAWHAEVPVPPPMDHTGLNFQDLHLDSVRLTTPFERLQLLSIEETGVVFHHRGTWIDATLLVRTAAALHRISLRTDRASLGSVHGLHTALDLAVRNARPIDEGTRADVPAALKHAREAGS